MDVSNDWRAEHPAGITKDAGWWYGVEVEGIHLGTPTVFVAAKVGDADVEKIVAAIRAARVKQLFFTETFDAWEWAKERGLFSLDVLTVVGRTLEQVPQLPAYVRERVELIVRVFDPRWLLLRACDQVSFGVPYDLRTVAVAGSVPTMPADYVGDEEVLP